MNMAIAIPTYNSLNKLKVLLEKNYRIYVDHNCDFYVYDSSDTEDTKEYLARNYENIIYKRFDSSITSNEKVYILYEQLSDRYDYIWMRRDATWFEEDLIGRVIEALNQDKPDILFINSSAGYYKKECYSDAKEFSLCAMGKLTAYGYSIVNCEMLRSADWIHYREKYLFSSSSYFSHVGLFVEQAASLDIFKGVILEYPARKKHPIKNESFWYSDIVKVWAFAWVSFCENLGQIFDNDPIYVENIINSIEQRFSEEQLIIYRALGWFDFEIFEMYKKYICRVTNVDVAKLEEIAMMTEACAYDICVNRVKNIISDSVKNYKRIVIYGAGVYGKRLGKIFDSVNIGFEGYMVTHSTEKVAPDGHLIFQLDEYELGDDTGIVLGLGKENQTEVMGILDEKDYASNVCLDVEKLCYQYAFLFEH